MQELVLDPSLDDIVHFDQWARNNVAQKCVTADMAI